MTSNQPSSEGGERYAVLQTSQGRIAVHLFVKDAPRTVANFEELARAGFYNNLVWHRIVSGFVIQTGDPNTKNAGGNPRAWGQGGSGTTIPFENSGMPNDLGYLAMARGQSFHSASSQFFINLTNNASLNGLYAVFGRVVSGLDVVTALGNVPVSPECRSSGGLFCQPLDPAQAMLVSVTIQDKP